MSKSEKYALNLYDNKKPQILSIKNFVALRYIVRMCQLNVNEE